MKLFATSVSNAINKKENKIWNFVTYEVASSKEEAYGKVQKRYAERYEDFDINIVEISEDTIAEVILSSLSGKREPTEELRTDDVRLLQDIAAGRKYYGLMKGSTVVKMCKDAVAYINRAIQNSQNNFNYAAKVYAELNKTKASLKEADASREKLVNEKLTLETELSSVKDSINIVLEANEKLKASLVASNQELCSLDADLKNVEDVNKSLNTTINNYESALSKRDEEVETLKKRISELEEIFKKNSEADEKLAARLMDFSDQFREMSDEL